MSQFNMKFADGSGIVFGFDHAIGPFYEEWDNYEEDDEPLVSKSYQLGIDGKIDCHDLAEILQGHVDKGQLDVDMRLMDRNTGDRHSVGQIIERLWLDLPC